MRSFPTVERLQPGDIKELTIWKKGGKITVERCILLQAPRLEHSSKSPRIARGSEPGPPLGRTWLWGIIASTKPMGTRPSVKYVVDSLPLFNLEWVVRSYPVSGSPGPGARYALQIAYARGGFTTERCMLVDCPIRSFDREPRPWRWGLL